MQTSKEVLRALKWARIRILHHREPLKTIPAAQPPKKEDSTGYSSATVETESVPHTATCSTMPRRKLRLKKDAKEPRVQYKQQVYSDSNGNVYREVEIDNPLPGTKEFLVILPKNTHAVPPSLSGNKQVEWLRRGEHEFLSGFITNIRLDTKRFDVERYRVRMTDVEVISGSS